MSFLISRSTLADVDVLGLYNCHFGHVSLTICCIRQDGLLICLEKAARYDLAHEVPAVSSQRISLTWRWFRPEFLEQLQRMEMQLGDAG